MRHLRVLALKKRLGHFLGTAMPRVTVRLYKGALALLLSTCRWRVVGVEFLQAAVQEGSCAIVAWHDRLAIVAPLLYRYVPQYRYAAVISNSFEGRLLARLVSSYRQSRILKVPHNGRPEALRQMIRVLRHGKEVLVITPDGPNGPRHCIKPGIAFAALQSSATIVPVTWRSSRYWELSTWDRMAIPKPFSTIEVAFGSPCTFGPSMSVQKVVEALQASME